MKKMTERKDVITYKIFWFYRWGMMVVPILLMLAHWLVDWNNTACINLLSTTNPLKAIAMYIMAYIFPLAFMMPASYFFKFHWVWRIPFYYLLAINLLNIVGVLVFIPGVQRLHQLIIAAVVVVYIYVFTKDHSRI